MSLEPLRRLTSLCHWPSWDFTPRDGPSGCARLPSADKLRLQKYAKFPNHASNSENIFDLVIVKK
jgi:hypothetical protein